MIENGAFFRALETVKKKAAAGQEAYEAYLVQNVKAGDSRNKNERMGCFAMLTAAMTVYLKKDGVLAEPKQIRDCLEPTIGVVADILATAYKNEPESKNSGSFKSLVERYLNDDGK